MNDLERQIILSAVLRLADNEVVLTPTERRDVINELCHGLCDMSLEEILGQTENNRKLQIKRGDTTANDEYLGLAGEITIDLENKTVRVHDGETMGGVAMAKQCDTPTISTIINATTPDYENGISISANITSYSDKNYLAIAGGGAGAKQSLLISKNPDMSDAKEVLTLYITSVGNIYFNNQAIIPRGYYFQHNFSVLNTYPIGE